MKKIAVITICYNDRDGLARTMASVFEQSCQEVEYIVVDGGSTDGSVQLIKASAEQLDHWVSERDGGIFDAQNKGWRMASAPWVLFLNAGDTLAAADVLEKALSAIAPGTTIAYGDLELSDDRGVYRTKRYPARITTAWLMKEALPHPAQFIRRETLLAQGGYDTTYRIAADHAFITRLLHEGDPVLQKLDLVVSRFDTRGMSSDPAQRQRLLAERKEIQRRYAPRFWYWIYQAYAALNRSIGR